MRTSKSIEEVLPVYKIEENILLSRKADITAGYEICLPEIFTLSPKDYETVHQTWLKAIRLLPMNTILHKQDWYTESNYQGNWDTEEKGFLSQCSERYFHERPYLNHECYLYLTKKATTGTKTRKKNVLKGSIVPADSIDTREVTAFLDKCDQFAKILSDSGFFKVDSLTSDSWLGKEGRPGLLERYCFLMSKEDKPVIKDIELRPEVKIGNFYNQIFSIADVEDLPSKCNYQTGYEKYSTDKTKLPVSFAGSLGLLLYCNHIYNQYIVIEDHQLLFKKLEAKRRRLQALSAHSRENSLGKDAIDEYLNEAIGHQRLPVSAHYNIITWTEDKGTIKEIRNNVSSALAKLDVKAKLETSGAPLLFLSGVPGGAAELPSFETFSTFAEQATCFFVQETNYQTSVSPVGIRLGDRLTGRPLHVDISDEVFGRVINNRNKFLLGPSGSGKSFYTNHLCRSYFEQGSHVLVVDVGHSYKGLCSLVGGYYFTYSETQPLSFNPFFLDEGALDTEKKESIKTMLLALWKKDTESFSRAEYVSLSNALQNYYFYLHNSKDVFPCFNTFYEFVRDQFIPALKKEGVKEKDFDIDNFLYVLRPFYVGGEYDYLLNARENLDLLNQRFIVFELDNIKDNQILFAISTLVVMQIYISKLRRLKGVRKIILIEEAWKAISRNGMAEYIKYLFKTVRKWYGEAWLVTQEVDDIIGNSIIKDAIINNSDCKILLDQSKYINKFDKIQDLLGISDKEKNLILSLNKANDHSKKYKEVFISLGGTISKVYRTEVSLEEYLCYSTEEKEKIKVQEYAHKYGDMRKGIVVLADEMRKGLLAA